MRAVFVILFFAAVVTNELVFDILMLQDAEISLFDSSTETSTEKEPKDPVEDESKTDYFSDNLSGASFSIKLYKSSTSDLAALLRTTYKEIHSPPPDYS